jgi:SAM-dependent methyltransferase
MDPKSHWDRVYRTKRSDEVSWFRRHLDISLKLIKHAAPARDAAIIDVGGGEATLVDDLVADGYRNVDVLDISPIALEVARKRLGADAHRVRWICGDVTTHSFALAHYDVWHDRAVFHFLTEPAARAAYVRQVARAVRIGGHVIVATFGPEGPLRCSGLDVIRYDPDKLHGEFGPAFRLVEHLTEQHQTPAGAIQQFVYCHCSVEHAAR